MKIKFTLLAASISLYSITMMAQSPIIIDCTHRTYCEYNVYLQEYSNCDGYDEYSRFEFNQNDNLFIHYTEDLVSYYYINGSKYNSDKDILTLKVMSDAGNEYEYQINYTNRNITAYFLNEGFENLKVEFKMNDEK